MVIMAVSCEDRGVPPTGRESFTGRDRTGSGMPKEYDIHTGDTTFWHKEGE